MCLRRLPIPLTLHNPSLSRDVTASSPPSLSFLFRCKFEGRHFYVRGFKFLLYIQQRQQSRSKTNSWNIKQRLVMHCACKKSWMRWQKVSQSFILSHVPLPPTLQRCIIYPLMVTSWYLLCIPLWRWIPLPNVNRGRSLLCRALGSVTQHKTHSTRSGRVVRTSDNIMGTTEYKLATWVLYTLRSFRLS